MEQLSQDFQGLYFDTQAINETSSSWGLDRKSLSLTTQLFILQCLPDILLYFCRFPKYLKLKLMWHWESLAKGRLIDCFRYFSFARITLISPSLYSLYVSLHHLSFLSNSIPFLSLVTCHFVVSFDLTFPHSSLLNLNPICFSCFGLTFPLFFIFCPYFSSFLLA